MTTHEFGKMVARVATEMELAEGATQGGANRVGLGVFHALRGRDERLARWTVRRALKRAGVNPDRLGAATL